MGDRLVQVDAQLLLTSLTFSLVLFFFPRPQIKME